MKTILTPVDFSTTTQDVIGETIALAGRLGAHVLLLHSLQPPLITTEYGIGIEVLQETLAINEKVAVRQLNHLQASLAAKGISAETLLVNGLAEANILEQARKHKVDYII